MLPANLQIINKVRQFLQCSHKPTLLLKVHTESLINWVELVAKLQQDRTEQVRQPTHWMLLTIEKARISSLLGAILCPERPSNKRNRSPATLELN